MIKVFFAFVFCLFILRAFSQNKSDNSQELTQIDSLNIVFSQTNNTFVKDSVLNKLFWEYYDVNHDSLMCIAKKSLRNLNEFNDKNIKTKVKRAIAKAVVGRKYVTSYNNLAIAYELNGQFDSSLYYYFKIFDLVDTNANNKNIATLYGNIGISYEYQGMYDEALKYYFKSMRICIQKRDVYETASLLSNIGLVYYYIGDFETAAEYFYKSIFIANHYNDNLRAAFAMGNLGMVYFEQKEYAKCLELYFKSLNIAKEHKNPYQIQMLQKNISKVYHKLGNYIKAIDYLNRAKALSGKSGFIKDYADACNILGELYLDMEMLDSSSLYFKRAYEINIQTNERSSLIGSCLGLGNLNIKKIQFKKSIKYYHEALILSENIGSASMASECAVALSDAYKKEGNLAKALEFSELANEIIDSLRQLKAKVELKQLHAVYDFDRKQYKLKLDHEKERIENRTKIKEQQVLLYVFLGGLLVAVAAALGFYNSYKQKRKQKDEIQQQRDQLAIKNEYITQQKDEILAQRAEIEKSNELILKKNSNITDSLKYAKRIQNAILPARCGMDSLFTEYFVLNKPKDIVSGDFYWIDEKDDRIYLAVVDCTGHGVPGAFMSIVSNDLLYKAVHEERISNTGGILKSISESLYGKLKKEEGAIKDGMDIALCTIDRKTNEFYYSGVHNPAIIIRGNEVIYFKADRQPIGASVNGSFVNYSEVKFQLLAGDLIYLFTDGYYDQFGGPNNRKYMKKRFRELLKTISGLSMAKQKETLEVTFEDWKAQGNIEQIDDVLVLGVKI